MGYVHFRRVGRGNLRWRRGEVAVPVCSRGPGGRTTCGAKAPPPPGHWRRCSPRGCALLRLARLSPGHPNPESPERLDRCRTLPGSHFPHECRTHIALCLHGITCVHTTHTAYHSHGHLCTHMQKIVQTATSSRHSHTYTKPDPPAHTKAHTHSCTPMHTQAPSRVAGQARANRQREASS